MKKQESTIKTFVLIGITFIGTGVVFITSVNSGIGVGMIGIGMVWIIIGIKKQKTNKNKI